MGEDSTMQQYIHLMVYSMGDNQLHAFDDLLKLLEKDYEIVSAVSDQYKLNYILRRPTNLLNSKP